MTGSVMRDRLRAIESKIAREKASSGDESEVYGKPLEIESGNNGKSLSLIGALGSFAML